MWVDGTCLRSSRAAAEAHMFQCLGRCTVQLGPHEDDKGLAPRDALREGQLRRSLFSQFASEIQKRGGSSDVAGAADSVDGDGGGSGRDSAVDEAAEAFPSCRAFSYAAVVTDSLPLVTARATGPVRHCREERWALLSGSSYDAATLFLSQQLRQVFWGGVAVLLSTRSWEGGEPSCERERALCFQPCSESTKGELFCFLPLGTYVPSVTEKMTHSVIADCYCCCGHCARKTSFRSYYVRCV